jgi:hypothetical protein
VAKPLVVGSSGSPPLVELTSGDLTLPGNPTTALGAATKQYVDAQDALHVLKAGDTMSAPLVVDQGPLGAVTVGDPLGGSARVIITSGGQPTSYVALDAYGEKLRFLGSYRGSVATIYATLDFNTRVWTHATPVVFSNGATINSSGSGGIAGTVTLSDSGVSGANLLFIGNGSTTPNKTIRVVNGSMSFANSAYNSVITTMTDTGAWSAPSFTSTSDEKLKKNIAPCDADNYLADKLDFVTFDWKADDWANNVRGVIAQQVQNVAPQYVHADAVDIEGKPVLSVNKIDLLLECIIGLASRVRELESKLKGEL